MPISLINLINSDTQWSIAGYGTELHEIPREMLMHPYTVLDGILFEIEDLSEDPFFKDKEYVLKDPKLRYYAGVPLKTTDGHNIGSLCVFDDQVNKLKPWQLESLEILADEVIAHLDLQLREKELEELSAQRSKIVNIVSHDLRNPLSGIIGIAKLVGEDGVEDEKELAYMMQLIDKSAMHLLQNVNNLLDVSQIESVPLQLNPSLIDIKKATLNIVSLHRAAAKVKNIELETVFNIFEKGLYDEVRFEQILGNLITNAIKFTPAGGKITIRLWYPIQPSGKAKQGLKFEVEDTGIGIPEKFMDILFTKFGEHGRQGTTGEKSFGLGLPMLKGLIDSHGGNVVVKSKEGEGTIFTVFLPELEADNTGYNKE
jgi:signal transduction histidine kinase